VGLPKFEVSREPIVSQSLFTNPINKAMSMEQIFQDINKEMLETTYVLRLGQLLKITRNFKKYMWQNLKQEKPNIVSDVRTKLC